MSDLETKISELERELSLKKGFQSIRFVLPKYLPADVATEIQTTMRKLADGLALNKDKSTVNYGELEAKMLAQFSSQEVDVLKMLAAQVMKKANPVSEGAIPAQAQPEKSVSTVHSAKPKMEGRNAKVIVTENVRGEGKKYIAVDDELFVGNPSSVDKNGMVSATHMKRGFVVKVPLDDLEFLT